MEKKTAPVDCYIYSVSRPPEPYLEAGGFAHGLILFAIPCFGLLFKCRAEGDPLNLEFGAFISAMRFIEDSLSQHKISTVRVHSSNPEFVFSLSNGGRQLFGDAERQKMLAKAQANIKVTVCYVAVTGNKALVSPLDYPSTPTNQKPVLKPTREERTKTSFKPIQKGIKL